MKVEATCVNGDCIAVGYGMLVSCERVNLGAKKVSGETCPFCGGDTLEVTKLTTEDAQLATGDVTLSKGIIDLFGGEKFVAAQAVADLVAEHARKRHNMGDAISDWVRESTAISIVTNPERTKTVVMLTREYPFATS